jgi:hypothetical protein
LSNRAYSNGVVLVMPAVTDPGAVSASGELIFGVDTIAASSTLSNNTVPTGIKKVLMGIDWTNPDAYLNITTQLKRGVSVQTFVKSYLDTGTNGLFFNDGSASPIDTCPVPQSQRAVWYCPQSTLSLSATLSDGGSTLLNSVDVLFQVGNANALFSTSNTAFGDMAGVAPVGSTAFAWGMPFFYGKRVYMSIWDITGPVVAPWYAWTGL